MLIVIQDQGAAQTITFDPDEEGVYLAISTLADALDVGVDGVPVAPYEVGDDAEFLEATFPLTNPGVYGVSIDGEAAWTIRVDADGGVAVQQVGSTATVQVSPRVIHQPTSDAADQEPPRRGPTLWHRLRDDDPTGD